MRVGIVASEMAPLAKTGGLGDMVGALPRALAARGHDVFVLLPRYRSIPGADIGPGVVLGPVTAHLQGQDVTGGLRLHEYTDGVRLLTVEQPHFFDRPALYDEHGGEYGDNAYRFAFFSLAVLQAATLLGEPFDILHCHDWQAALVPFYLRTRAWPRTADAATLLTIHNVGYQGNYAPDVVAGAGLGWEAYTWRGIEFYGRVSLLKAGLLTADRLNTVSPRYAYEIQTPEGGAGLDGVLRDRTGHLDGILNGADYDIWNPEKDAYISQTYSADQPEGKRACRRELALHCGWGLDEAGPIFGVISRLVHQKGADLLPAVIPTIRAIGGRLVVLGTGEPGIEDALQQLATHDSQHVHVTLRFNDGLAHRILAGCDMLLMPSRYEPCGLTQLYGLRYGTVPIVRATGGLVDTIIPFGDGIGTGFVFSEPTPAALADAIRAAARVFGDTEAWSGLQKRGMLQRFLWASTAEAYERSYSLAIQASRARPPLPWRAV